MRHPHGTASAYAHDACRCPACHAAAIRAMKRGRHRRAAGQFGYVDGTGTRRRIQGLALLGWTCADIAARLGTTKQAVAMYGRRYGAQSTTKVTRATADNIAALTGELMLTPRTGWVAKRTARQAQALGYLPLLAWDDIDNPDAVPQTPANVAWTRDLAPCGTVAAARRHYRRGEPLCQACRGAANRARAGRVA